MYTNRHWLLALVLFLLAPALAPADVIDLEDLTLPGPNSFVNNPTGTLLIDTPVASTITSRGAGFNNVFQNATLGSVVVPTWSGWSYSNVTNVTTPGFGNQYAAYNAPSGTGAGGSANYAIGFDDTFTPGGRPVIALPSGMAPVSVQLTNSTYTALSMLNGDSFAKKFGGLSGNDPDFFVVRITGFDAGNAVTGFVDFYLADYRFADNALDYVISSWTTVDLTSLGATTTKLAFTLDSSDFSDFGPGARFLNTPSYFALDNLVVQGQPPAAVPEPGTLGLAVVGAAALLVSRRRRKASFE